MEPKVLHFENPETDDDTLIKELQAMIQGELDDTTQLLNGEIRANTNISNRTNHVLTKIDTHFWAGEMVNTWWPDLVSNAVYLFVQKGTLPQGIKWGFSLATGTESTDRKWVAAFDVVARKAYCECGPIGPVDWNVVEDRLGKSGSISEYVDPIFGGSIKVQFYEGQYGVIPHASLQ